MLTVMGIKAQQMELDMSGANASVTKIMAANPRRIATIKVEIKMPKGFDDKARKILEHTAHTCPVHNSLHPDINKLITFEWA